MKIEELRRLLATARVYAVDGDLKAGKWCWSVAFLTDDADSIANMQAKLDAALPALLDVAVCAQVVVNDPGNAVSRDALESALLRLKEA